MLIQPATRCSNFLALLYCFLLTEIKSVINAITIIISGTANINNMSGILAHIKKKLTNINRNSAIKAGPPKSRHAMPNKMIPINLAFSIVIFRGEKKEERGIFFMIYIYEW